MDAAPYDPRDGRWQAEPTAYRVDFWRPQGNLAPRKLRIGVPYSQDTYALRGARDVAEALDWARANAGDRTFTLHAIYDGLSERGSVHLFGVNPTRGHVSTKQAAEATDLFNAHGFPGDPLMYPVTTVDERVFVVTPQERAAMTAIEELVTSLERVLEAPVRIETIAHRDAAG